MGLTITKVCGTISTNLHMESRTKTFPRSLPTRLWICPACDSRFNQRWLLARHLREVHGVRKGKADEVAAASEYWLKPSYVRREDAIMEINPEDFESDTE